MRRHWPGLQQVEVGEETQHVACDERGCPNLPSIRCALTDVRTIRLGPFRRVRSVDLTFYYCQSHCTSNGFCYACGQFWAGIESFDFARERGGIKGVCENCTDQIKADAGEYDDEEYVYEGDLP